MSAPPVRHAVTTPEGVDRAEQLLAMSRRLVDLIRTEIAALRARRLDGAGRDWDEKERLVHAYRLEVAAIKANPAALDGARSDQKQALKAAARDLEEALTEHANALAAMKDVSEGLVKAVATEIAAHRSAPTGYGRSGAIDPGRRDASGIAVDAKA
jgi:hypothetical protein